ncbi:MAG: hypothetical protein AAGF74_04195 [Pseudomonadota bacterium]
MLQLALFFICVSMITHLARHWTQLTWDLLEERRYGRMKSSMDWRARERNPRLGSSKPGSALGRF